jgi:uncharacterized protein YcfJ
MRKVFVVVLLVISLMSVCGCTTTEKAASIGAATGAGVGAIIGHQSGCTAEGAAIGAIAGILTGGFIGKQMEDDK